MLTLSASEKIFSPSQLEARYLKPSRSGLLLSKHKNMDNQSKLVSFESKKLFDITLKSVTPGRKRLFGSALSAS
jgi:hypothetical protein